MKPILGRITESRGQANGDNDSVEHRMSSNATITLGVQSGGADAGEQTEPHFYPLRKLLQTQCRGPYSQEVDEFSLILRIDGDIDHWEQEGCDRMRRSKKDRYITIDIYVPRQRWQGVSGDEIRRYLAACVEDAFGRMIAKLRKDKVAVDGDALLRDFAAVKAAYLDLQSVAALC